MLILAVVLILAAFVFLIVVAVAYSLDNDPPVPTRKTWGYTGPGFPRPPGELLRDWPEPTAIEHSVHHVHATDAGPELFHHAQPDSATGTTCTDSGGHHSSGGDCGGGHHTQ